jgi:hypothetical protein
MAPQGGRLDDRAPARRAGHVLPAVRRRHRAGRRRALRLFTAGPGPPPDPRRRAPDVRDELWEEAASSGSREAPLLASARIVAMTTDPADARDFAVEVCRALALAGDPERAAGQQAYMKSQLPFHGVTSAQLKALLGPLLADDALRPATREAWEATVRDLWDNATHREQRYAATALLAHRSARRWHDPRPAAPAPSPHRHRRVVGSRRRHRDPSRRANPAAAQ